jgi:Amt family ammonium transporter
VLCGFIFWLIGYTLAFGEGSSFMGIHYYQGGKDMFAKKQYAMFLFQLSYASTPSTITSGAVVDRISLLGYIMYSTIISGNLILNHRRKT